MELVSAIITTHNRRLLLSRAIESVFSQTYKALELIVVDDHSDDGTDEICHNPKINYIYIPKNESRGGNYARNLGIKAAKGIYCAFLDDDDYWLPTKIEKQVSLIQKMDCELVYCGRSLEIVHGETIVHKNILPDTIDSGDMGRNILYTICTTTSCMLCKKAALYDVGLFDEELGFWQEYELTIRMAQRKPFYFVNEALVIYRIDESDKGRLTNKYFAWKQSVASIYKKHAALYEKLNFIEKIRVKMLYFNDARRRCKAAKLYSRYILLILLCLPERLVCSFMKVLKRYYYEYE